MLRYSFSAAVQDSQGPSAGVLQAASAQIAVAASDATRMRPIRVESAWSPIRDAVRLSTPPAPTWRTVQPTLSDRRDRGLGVTDFLGPPQPGDDCRDGGPCSVDDGVLLVASGQAAPLLERVEGPFDDVAPLVGLVVGFGGRPPSEPRRLRLDYWSDGSGITTLIPRRRSRARFPREEYALSPSTASGVVLGRLAPRRGTQMPASKTSNVRPSCDWPGHRGQAADRDHHLDRTHLPPTPPPTAPRTIDPIEYEAILTAQVALAA